MELPQDLICICCPRGCHLHVDENLNVTGNTCPRGAVYGKQEVVNPTRVVTSTVRIEGSNLPMCPVKTNGSVPKAKIFATMEEINKVKIIAPIHIGDVVIHNVAGTDIDIVACRDMEKVN